MPSTETMYERLGGMETLRRLAEAFYRRVEGDPILRPMFRKNLSVSAEQQALFFAEVFGGPKEFSKKRRTTDLRALHAGRKIGSKEAHAWLDHMEAALEEVIEDRKLRHNLHCFIWHEAGQMGDPLNAYESLPLEELEAKLTEKPELATMKGASGDSLLIRAAGAWDEARVRLLLERGAEINDGDGFGHAALYAAANHYAPSKERERDGGKAVAELLIRYGANVNAASGPDDQTPLHMTARRGNVGIAEALLDAGADIEARDKKGETPLRRAANCGQKEIAALLLSRGADPNAPDQKGKTPRDAARRPEMIEILNRDEEKA